MDSYGHGNMDIIQEQMTFWSLIILFQSNKTKSSEVDEKEKTLFYSRQTGRLSDRQSGGLWFFHLQTKTKAANKSQAPPLTLAPPSLQNITWSDMLLWLKLSFQISNQPPNIRHPLWGVELVLASSRWEAGFVLSGVPEAPHGKDPGGSEPSSTPPPPFKSRFN